MKLTKPLITVIIIAIIATIGLAFLGYQQLTTKPQKVTIAQFGDLLLYLPLYIAQHEGIFAKQGLAVDIVSTGGDDKTFAAVLSGGAQFGLADPTFVAIAQERGQVGKVVALLIDGVPNYGVALSSDLPVIRKPSDLAGKTVATVPAPSTSYALVRKLFETGKLPPSIYQVAPPGLVPSLQAKRADYALLIEPWVSQVVAAGGKVAFSLMDYYPHFALTGLTTSKEVIQSSPEPAFKVIAALTEAVKVFYDDDEAAFRAAKSRFPSESPEILKQGIRRLREDKIYPRCLVMTDAAWEPAVRLRREFGDLQRDPGPMGNYVDNTFAQRGCSPTRKP